MVYSKNIIKHLSFTVILLFHVIFLFILSYIVFKTVITTFTNRNPNGAQVFFEPEEISSNKIAEPITQKNQPKIASNIKDTKSKPKPYQGNKDKIKPTVIQKPKQAIQEVKKPELPIEEQTPARQIAEPKVATPVSDAISTENSKPAVSAPKMSGKAFLSQALANYDRSRYDSQDQEIENLGNDSKSRHERVLQERVAYWNDYGYLESLDDAIIDEANKYKDYHIYFAEDLNDVYDIEISLNDDGTLHSIDKLTGIKEVDGHLTNIFKKAKYPKNKRCKIYKYKTKIRVNLQRGLNPIKITKPRYWN